MLETLTILFAPALFGLPLAAWAYPWRRLAIRPYLWFVIGLTAPLLGLFFLHALFGLPPGTCADRPVNYLRYWSPRAV